MKEIIKESKIFKKYIFIRLVGLGTFILNVIIQRVYRVDSDFRHMKNWRSRVINGQYIKLGLNPFSILKSFAISGGCYFNAGQGIEIGDGTIWASNVSIVSMNHNNQDLSIPAIDKGPIIIGKNCWIGTGVVILSGVSLGDHTIVGANAVVSKSFVEGNVIIGGVPAKVLRKL